MQMRKEEQRSGKFEQESILYFLLINDFKEYFMIKIVDDDDFLSIN